MSVKTLKKLCATLAILFGIASCAMIFLSAVSSGSDNPTTYSGLDLSFGKTISSGSLLGQSSSTKILFSFPVLLAYALPLVGALVIFIGVIIKKKALSFIFGLIAFLCFVGSIVLLIFTRNMATMEVSISGLVSGSTSAHFTDWDIGIGTILAIVFSGVGLCISGTFTLLNLLKK